MVKWKVKFMRYSPELSDGSRKSLEIEEICECKFRGNAELIARLLRNQEAWNELLSVNEPDKYIYRIIVER